MHVSQRSSHHLVEPEYVLGVSQGYSRTSEGAPQVPPIPKKLPFTKSASFRSDNDTMRDIFGAADNQVPRPTPSVDKRKYTDDDDDDDDDDDNGVCLSDDDVDMTDTSGKKDVLTRPMKPLKQVRGRGKATQSLPTFRLPTDAEGSNETSILGPGSAMEEEDWSKENFA